MVNTQISSQTKKITTDCQTQSGLSEEAIWQQLDEIKDPEIPNISIIELGMIRGFQVNSDYIEVTLTPTFSACPAQEMIKNMVLEKLSTHFADVKVTITLDPPWTTEDIDPACFEKMKQVGIAPPLTGSNQKMSCPRCQSLKVEQLSFFGSTGCKAQYRCMSCLEPFEYFKPVRPYQLIKELKLA